MPWSFLIQLHSMIQHFFSLQFAPYSRISLLTMVYILPLLLLWSPLSGYSNPFGVGSGNRSPSCTTCHTWVSSLMIEKEMDPSFEHPYVSLESNKKQINSEDPLTLTIIGNGGQYSLRGFFLTVEADPNILDLVQPGFKTKENSWNGYNKPSIINDETSLKEYVHLLHFSAEAQGDLNDRLARKAYFNPKDLGWLIEGNSYDNSFNYLEQSINLKNAPIQYHVIAPKLPKKLGKVDYQFKALMVYAENEYIDDLESISGARLLVSKPLIVTVKGTANTNDLPEPLAYQKPSNNLEQLVRESFLLSRQWIIGMITWMLLTLAFIFFIMRKYYIRQLQSFPHKTGAEIWWLTYLFLRDAFLILGITFGLIYIFPSNMMNLSNNQLVKHIFAVSNILVIFGVVLLIVGYVIKRLKNIEKNDSFQWFSYLFVSVGYLFFTIGFLTTNPIQPLYP